MRNLNEGMPPRAATGLKLLSSFAAFAVGSTRSPANSGALRLTRCFDLALIVSEILMRAFESLQAVRCELCGRGLDVGRDRSGASPDSDDSNTSVDHRGQTRISSE
jgi:hypothetical protein